jgi:hypothetical protein
MRLIKLDLKITWHFEVGLKPITGVGNFIGELDAAALQLGHGF